MTRALLALLLGTGCVGLSATFPCDESSQCVEGGAAGTCEATGFCSFVDSSCPDGSRYSSHAATGLAGKCVGDLPETDAAAGADVAPGACGTTDDLGPEFTLAEWEAYPGKNSSVSIEDGEALLRISQGGAWGSLATRERYAFDESAVEVQLIASTSAPLRQQWGGGIQVIADEAAMELLYSWGGLDVRLDGDIVRNVPHDEGDDLYLRLSERSGTMYWETSNDRLAWDTLHSSPTPVPLSEATVNITSFANEDAEDVTLRFKDLNTGAPPCVP